MIDYKNLLNKEQYEAVTTTEGPLLIIAGAGTGKTRTIVYRAAYLIEHCASPEQILMLTFTNKAANEMKERVYKLLNVDNNSCKITACTFHSFCVKMLRVYHKQAYLDPNFVIIDDGDDADIISMKKAEAAEHKYDKKGFPPSAKISSIISTCINCVLTVEEVLQLEGNSKYKCFADDIQELWDAAKQYKMENSLLNYDDLLLHMKYLLKNCPNIAKKISDAYKYIMVDEYQDTNILQDEILLLLRQDNKNLAVVGDDMQSLYGFRGANVKNIITFPNRVSGCKKISLYQNYRSNQEILDLSNAVMECATEGFQKRLAGFHKSGRLPIVHALHSQIAESAEAVKTIREFMDQGIPLKEICVLGRNSSMLSDLEVELTSEDIPYVKYGGKKFLEREYVKDVLSYMRVVARDVDEIAMFRILKIHRGIGNAIAKTISAKYKEFGRDHLTDPQYKKKGYADGLKNLHEELCRLEALPLTEMVENAIRFYVDVRTDYIEKIKTDEGRRTEYFEELSAQRKELFALINISKGYSNVTDFLDDLMMDNTKLTQNKNDGDNLVLSTIHSAKGLEFEAVIMMDCIDEMFPSTTYADKGTKEDNEELRCFYVAMTRAKEHLHIMYPESAYTYKGPLKGYLAHYIVDASDKFCMKKCYHGGYGMGDFKDSSYRQGDSFPFKRWL